MDSPSVTPRHRGVETKLETGTDPREPTQVAIFIALVYQFLERSGKSGEKPFPINGI